MKKKFKKTLYYSYINRKDLLLESIASVKDAFENIVIVNNTDENLDIEGVKEIKAQVPLSFSQVMNFFQKMSLEKDDDYWVWSHTDMLAPTGIAKKFRDYVEENFDRNWCTAHTSYDILSAWHTKNFAKVGPFDWRMFPNYCADNDYYRRIDLGGFEILRSGLEVIHQNQGSNTIKQGDIWQREHNINYPLHCKAFEGKWGGPVDKPDILYKTPYNI